MSGNAIVSPDGVYRYSLGRRIPSDLQGIVPVVFIMLNPSVADAKQDDPTIRRCMGFAKSWGHTSLVVVNLFSLRATNPNELYTHADPIGPDGDLHIQMATDDIETCGGTIICAWGSHGAYQNRGCQVVQMLRDAGRHLHCLGLTKYGHPKHPLYLKADLQPMEMP